MPLLPLPRTVRRGLSGLCLLLIASGSAPWALAGTQSANDGFNPNVAGVVDSLAVQADGKIVIGGGFTALQPNSLANPVTRFNIARVNTDGSVDTSFDPEANGPVLAVAVQSNGKILIGGSFTTLQPNGAGNPVAVPYLTRINSDGSLDRTFNPTPGGAYGGKVTAITLQSNGQILVGGYFTTMQPNGAASANSVPYLARLNSDGSVDTTFKPTPNAPVAAIVLQSSGQILIGGTFTSIQANGAAAVTVGNIARLNADGSLDKTFNPTANNQVRAIAIQSNGQILIGGAFTSLQPNGSSTSVTSDFLARLNPDGSIDTSFTPQLTAGVEALIVQSNGQILVGGELTGIGYANGTSFSVSYLARLNADGSGDSSFMPSPNYVVNALAVQADGKIVIGGGFTQLKPKNAATATVRDGLARVNPDGTLDADFNPNANGGVGVLSLQSDGKLIFGGTFASVGGVTRSNIARLASDGSVDTAFDPEPNGPVMAIAVQSDGKVLVGGSFTTLRPNGAGAATARNYLARLNADGTLDTAFNPNPNGQIDAIVVQTDGKILVGGLFTTMTPNGATTALAVSYVARLNTDGTLDTTFEPNPSGQVKTIVLQPAKNGVIIGGAFTSVTPAANNFYSAVNYVARLNVKDGTLDTTFDPSPGGPIAAIVLQADGKFILGGNFKTVQPNPTTTVNSIYGGTTTTASNSTVYTRDFIARVNADGTVDTTYDPEANGPVLSLGLDPVTGKVVAGGLFTTISGASRSYIARLNTDGSADSAVTASPNGQVNTVLLLSTGSFYAGGLFTTITPASSPAVAIDHLALFNADGSFNSSFTPHASVTSQVRAIATQVDGKAVFAGSFSNLAGTTGVNLARFNTDGTPDSSFSIATDGPVNAVLMRPSGTPVSTQQVGVGWLTSTGQINSAFTHDPAATLSGQVGALAVQANGSLLVCGNFTNGTSPSGGDIVRFSPSGALDTSFHLNPNGRINAVVVQSDGKIVVAGQFTQIVGEAYNYIARFNPNGSVDTAYNPNAGGSINAMVLQPDGKIIIGGSFTYLTPNGQSGNSTRYYMARLNTDGTVDSTFNPNGNGQVDAIALQSDGKVLVGGQFTSFQPNGTGSNVTRDYVARLNADGTLDTTFDPESNSYVLAVAVQSDGKVLIGGTFTTLQPNSASSATTRAYLARLNADGTLDTTYDPEPSNSVLTLSMQSDGKVVVGGTFTNLQPNGASAATSRNYLARLNTDGTIDATFDPSPDLPVSVAIARADGTILIGGSFTSVQPSGAILVGGSFSTAGGSAAANLALLNADGSFNGAAMDRPNAAVYGMAIQTDGKTLVAGAFTSVGGTARSGLARLNTDNTVDAAFNPGVSGTVYAAAIQPDGRIVIGGSFTAAGGAARSNVARLNADGTLDSSFNPAVNGAVYSAVIQPNGQILLAGGFSSVGGVGRNNVARLNSDGSLDTGFNPNANGAVYALALQADGLIDLGGAFTSVGGTAEGYAARINSDGSVDTSFTASANGPVVALALEADGKLFLAGSFSQLGGLSRFGFGRLAPATEAVQSISASGDLSTVTWNRSGSSPEVSQASFQYSSDGYTWANLGQGTRVGSSGSWQITGLSLPAQTGFYLRTLAVVPTSQYGSGGLVRTVQQFYMVPTSALVSSSTSSGTAGSPFYYAAAATNSATSYSATGLPPGLTINATTGVISGTPTQAGTYSVTLTISNAGGSVTVPLLITVASSLSQTSVLPASRLFNLSTRGAVSPTSPLVDGFIVVGSSPKTLLLRAVGPALSNFSVSGVLAVPVLQLYDSSGRLILTNQGWDGSSSLSKIFAQTGAFPLTTGSADCAVVTTLIPGSYTLKLTSGNGTSGNAMAEIYDADLNPLTLVQRLANLSGRGSVDATHSLVGGFIITGTASKTVLVRGVGPALSGYGISGPLAAPILSVYDSGGNLLAQNTGWGNPVTVNLTQTAVSAAALSAAAVRSGAFALPAGSADSAVLVTLPAGTYTGQITATGANSGTTIFEVYEVP